MTRARRILASLRAILFPTCTCEHDPDCPWSQAGVGT